jgi:hypothetical protein
VDKLLFIILRQSPSGHQFGRYCSMIFAFVVFICAGRIIVYVPWVLSGVGEMI